MNIELRSAEEVAGVLGVELDTLYRYARKGMIRGMKVGKAWRFSEPDVEDFLHRHTYGSPPATMPGSLPGSLHQSPVTVNATRTRPPVKPVGASFADVDAASSQLAENLRKAGVIEGDRVVVFLANSIEFVIGCFAVWKVGANLVSEEVSAREENLSQVLRDCQPQALIVDHGVAERLDVHRHSLENVRVVYVKDRSLQLSGLRGLRVESFDTAMRRKNSANVIHLNGSGADEEQAIKSTSGTAEHPIYG